jgi:hypothetical protein
MDDDLTQRVRALEDRVLMLEAGLRAPMSPMDRQIAKAFDQKRWEPHEEARCRLEAFRKAQAEAERLGHRGPIDAFMRRLNAGEFDHYSN